MEDLEQVRPRAYPASPIGEASPSPAEGEAPVDATRRTLVDHLLKVGATALAVAMGGGAV